MTLALRVATVWFALLILQGPGCVRLNTLKARPRITDVAAIHELVKRREDSGKTGDVQAWLDCFTDDAIIMPANAPVVVGRKAIEEWERGFTGFRPDTSMTLEELVIRGDWAFMRSRISGAFVKAGERFPIQGKELAILRRVNGQWKFHRVCGNKDSGPRLERDADEIGR